MSNVAESTWGRVAVIRTVLVIAAALVVIAATSLPGFSQSRPDLQTFFEQNIGLSQDQIAAIRNGQPVAKKNASATWAQRLSCRKTFWTVSMICVCLGTMQRT